ncbi:MAG: ATP-binding protein [Chryseobacterium sp.]|nr:MAG: ATP-binding protein [Chryseobacterium sp.]
MTLEELKNFVREEAKPKPKATINSYRSFGYNMQTAVADIIDNSISARAGNVWIEYEWEGSNSWLTIRDDGNGMDIEGLVDALTPGSKDPEDPRLSHDLGRFGMGLKTASFSQCKRLTVASRVESCSSEIRCWDLDFVNHTGEWMLLELSPGIQHMQALENSRKGTLIVWEKLDKLVGDSCAENDAVRRSFLKEMDLLEEHLGMIFHRYIESRRLSIYLNGTQIDSWNPFLPKFGSTMMGKEFLGRGASTEVTVFILPHMSRLDELQRRIGEGPRGWYEQQGFYIYRNQRMLVCGDWLGLFPRNEHSKLARIAVDFNNDMDADWALDIKKSTARPPFYLRAELQRLGAAAIKGSASIYNHRGTLLKRNPNLPQFEFRPVWQAVKTREEGIRYKINRAHPIVSSFTRDFPSGQCEKLLKLIERSIPIETIIHYQSEDPGIHELRKEAPELEAGMVDAARMIFSALCAQGSSSEIAVKQVLNIEPFNHYPQLIEYLK